MATPQPGAKQLFHNQHEIVFQKTECHVIEQRELTSGHGLPCVCGHLAARPDMFVFNIVLQMLTVSPVI
jgi:hypothetical protein